MVQQPRKVPRRFTFIALTGIATLQGAWQLAPAVQAAIPPVWAQGITLVMAVLGVIGAFIDQPKTR